MYSLARDLRHGVRLFEKAPEFTAVALTTLALGIGATTAIFSVVDAVLWKPLPFRDPERVLVIWEKSPAHHRFRMFVAPFNYREWQAARSLEVAALLDARLSLTSGPNGAVEPEELRIEAFTAAMLPLLGVQPAIGRAFRPEEDQPGHSNFVLLSHALWERKFGADPAILGKSIRLCDQRRVEPFRYTVIGVMPPRFAVLDPDVDLWMPLGLNGSDQRVLALRNLTVIGRLKTGATLQQARRELEAMGERGEQVNPVLDAGWRPSPFPFSEQLVGRVQTPLLVLLAAVGLLLAMTCANVANLLLARASTRSKEIAVRAALGASRGRIASQLLTEGVLLSLMGGAFGTLLAGVLVKLLARLGGRQIPRLSETALDARLLLFALAMSVATGVLFGLAPAFFSSRANLNAALREGGRSGTMSRSGRAMRQVLVAAQVALAVVVMIGSGLLIRSFERLRAVNPGFQPEGLLTFRLPLPARLNTPERRVAFLREVGGRVQSLPGVTAVGAANTLPLTGFGGGSSFAVDGRPAPPQDQRPIALVRRVDEGYFRAIGIPLIVGRVFTEADAPQAPPVIVVNQTLARRFWPHGNPIGGRLVVDFDGGGPFEIVGVVGDVKPDRMDTEEWPTIYRPYQQTTVFGMVMVARTAGEPMALAQAVEHAVHQIDPAQPVADVRPMDAVMDQALAEARFQTVVLGIFALVAFTLSAVGIYGLISYDVTERTRELGIRMALGAEPPHILRLVLGQGARLAAYGIVAGLAAAYGLTRMMASMLYEVHPADAYTFASIAILLGLVALAASYLPSRRAMALDAVTALRHE
ncbi:MAG: ABC transporter permease [Bryobacteraceae bacterium]